MRGKSPSQSRIVSAAIVAQRVLVLDHHQGQVAEDLGMTNSSISRLLSVAKDERLYSVQMNLPRLEELEIRLGQRYGVEAIVAPVMPPLYESEKPIFTRLLGEAAARYLEGSQTPLKPGQTVGISCGATVRDTVLALSPDRFKNMTLFQLTVETECKGNIDQSPFTLVSILLGKWRSSTTKTEAIHPFPGTLFVKREEEWKITNQYEPIRDRMIDAANSMDIAIIGISNARSGSFAEILKKDTIKEKKVRKRIGEIMNRPYDADGKDLFDEIPEILEYVDAIALSVLKERVAAGRKVIAVAGGKQKVEPIRVALESRFLSHLITDMKTAEDLCPAS